MTAEINRSTPKDLRVIDRAFKSCFVNFKDNKYAKSKRLEDTDLKWETARVRFLEILEKRGVTKEDLGNWIAKKAFEIVSDHKEAHRDDDHWDYGRIFA